MNDEDLWGIWWSGALYGAGPQTQMKALDTLKGTSMVKMTVEELDHRMRVMARIQAWNQVKAGLRTMHASFNYGTETEAFEEFVLLMDSFVHDIEVSNGDDILPVL